MDDSKIEQIWCDRITRWGPKLSTEHSTPVILIGIGHDHKSGQITVCVPETFTDFEIMGILKAALFHLKKEDPFR